MWGCEGGTHLGVFRICVLIFWPAHRLFLYNDHGVKYCYWRIVGHSLLSLIWRLTFCWTWNVSRGYVWPHDPISGCRDFREGAKPCHREIVCLDRFSTYGLSSSSRIVKSRGVDLSFSCRNLLPRSAFHPNNLKLVLFGIALLSNFTSISEWWRS